VELLTSRFITVSELDGSGQPTQKQSARVDHRRRVLRALCNKAVSTIVIRTSAAAMGVPVKGVASIHPRWRYMPVQRKSLQPAGRELLSSKRLSGRIEGRHTPILLSSSNVAILTLQYCEFMGN